MLSDIDMLSEMLNKFNREGGFSNSILTDASGFLLASSKSEKEQNLEYQTASVALIQKTIKQANKRLGLGLPEEFSLSTTDGQNLVCRPFQMDGYELVLAIILANRRQRYRRITEKTIIEIRKTLNTCCS